MIKDYFNVNSTLTNVVCQIVWNNIEEYKKYKINNILVCIYLMFVFFIINKIIA